MKVIIYLFFIIYIANAQSKVTVAVLDLKSMGVSPTESSIISSRLRSELINTNLYDVVEREKMSDILNEQGFQLSGCTSNECVVEAGKILGVKKIITGDFGKIGKIYTLSIRLIDVETSLIEKNANIDCACSIEQVFTNSIKDIVNKLVRKNIYKKKTKYTQQMETKNGNIEEFDNGIIEPSVNVSENYKNIGTPLKNSIYSFFVPSWGQFNLNQNRAYIYLGIEIVSIMSIIYFYDRDQYYMANDNENNNYWEKHSEAERSMFLSIGLLSLNHLLSSLDAWISTSTIKSKLSKKYDMSLSTNYIHNNPQISLRVHF